MHLLRTGLQIPGELIHVESKGAGTLAKQNCVINKIKSFVFLRFRKNRLKEPLYIMSNVKKGHS